MIIGKTYTYIPMHVPSGSAYRHYETCEERFETGTVEYTTCVENERACTIELLCVLGVFAAIITGVYVWAFWHDRKRGWL